MCDGTELMNENVKKTMQMNFALKEIASVREYDIDTRIYYYDICNVFAFLRF